MELSSVEVIRSRSVPWGPINIIPLGDLQYDGTERCDFKRFKRVVEQGIEDDAYFIGMGDYVDFGSPSNRAKLKSALAEGALYDSASDALDYVAEVHLDEVMKVLEPTKGRWLGLLEGHHYWEFSDGTTSDTRLAQFLQAPFLGTSAMVQVKFKRNNKHAQPSFVIWAHHGRAGGKLLSAPLNQLENVTKGFDADIYLLGHHHKALAGKMSRVYPYFGERGASWLEHKDIVLACTGSFLKGYMEGNQRNGRAGGSYVEKGMMNPVALGHVTIHATPKLSEGVTSVRLDVTV